MEWCGSGEGGMPRALPEGIGPQLLTVQPAGQAGGGRVIAKPARHGSAAQAASSHNSYILHGRQVTEGWQAKQAW